MSAAVVLLSKRSKKGTCASRVPPVSRLANQLLDVIGSLSVYAFDDNVDDGDSIDNFYMALFSALEQTHCAFLLLYFY